MIVFGDIRDIEAFREIEVELNHRQLPFAYDRVADLEVDFRPVKRAAALVDFIVELMAFERFAERLFRGFPALRVADRGSAHGYSGGSCGVKYRLNRAERANEYGGI